MKSKQIIVRGLVQGVGFRKFVLRTAQELKISGWVRNLYSSEVEILAITSEDVDMESFLERVKKGPERSKVDRLETIDVDLNKLTEDDKREGFEINPDGEKKRVF